MQHSVIKQLKSQLLTVVLEKEPEASVQLFAMAAMHGDVESLDLIIEKIGDRLGNLEEMVAVRDGLVQILKDMDDLEDLQNKAEAAAKVETDNLMKRMGL
jgi:hypothetical protein